MSDQPKSLPTRGDRRSNGRAAGRNRNPGTDRQIPAQRRPDAPRSTPQVAPQPAQPGYAVIDQRQTPSAVTNPIFPRERIAPSYQIAPGEHPNPRAALPTASGASGFTSSLDLPLRAFANIPRGDFANVAKQLRANPSLLRQDAQALLREAIRAYGAETQFSAKTMYGDSCVQQHVILRRLQRLQQELVEARQHKKVTAEEIAEAINGYFDQLLDQASPSRKQLYEEVDKVRANAKRQLQGTGAGPPTPATSTQHTEMQRRTSSTSNQARQGALPLRVSSEIAPPSLATLNLHSSGGGDIRQPGPATEILRSENRKQLDEEFVVQRSDFYQPGRVFATLWHEPYSEAPGKAGNGSRHTCLSENVSFGLYQEPIYSSIRRMVVVRQDHGCCICIQINSYGRRGLAKFIGSTQDIEAHSIIHMDYTEPRQQPGEPRTTKRPIAVTKTNAKRHLNQWSRVCYSQPRTVQHTVRAVDVGWVTKESLPYLLSYFQQVNTLP